MRAEKSIRLTFDTAVLQFGQWGKKAVAGRNRESISNLLVMLHEAKPDSPYRAFMPPLVGTQAEIVALGDYLAGLVAVSTPATNAVSDKPKVAMK